ncbi:NADPH:quinone oxidoreductase family protein [Novosphingobium sp. G106]|uniref:NADPH:quinone oxidoreductase family protein n=1 Tax=Novosphingobium sp. G106 TaxID=2849500 RepID=UPI001C2D7E24|nr:NADPH:quinone oxidoreductase family protein [Novosphingobium sp. G106]MBV1687531.1 NADPH:quinone oxidoreductase family protein [Novosphingobium sp. G106]
MPRAIIADLFGPPEAYVIREHTAPDPGPGQIRVAVKAIGISYVDVLTAAGNYQVTPPLPFIPGSECAGIVEAVGEGVTHVAVGDRVMGSSFGGIFAEVGTFRASSFNKVPDALSLEEAAVFPPSYTTGYHALVQRGRLEPGETLLVLGAAGATGIAAIQIGKSLGARVIASASSEDKRQLCLKAGADAVVNTRSEDWRGEVKAAGEGKPIDVVFDPVGGDMTDPAFRTLGYDGRYLVIGFTGGISSLKTNLPLVKTASLIGVQLRTFGEAEPAKIAANMVKVLELAGQGKLRPVIGKVYAFDDYREAMNAAFKGEVAGRVVMKV